MRDRAREGGASVVTIYPAAQAIFHQKQRVVRTHFWPSKGSNVWSSLAVSGNTDDRQVGSGTCASSFRYAAQPPCRAAANASAS